MTLGEVKGQHGIDTSTAAGRMVFGVIASLAEFERELIVERVHAGLATARRRGRRGGRPHVRVDMAKARALRASGASWRDIGAELGVGTNTVRRAFALTA